MKKPGEIHRLAQWYLKSTACNEGTGDSFLSSVLLVLHISRVNQGTLRLEPYHVGWDCHSCSKNFVQTE